MLLGQRSATFSGTAQEGAAAFTVIELLVVISIMLLLAVIAVPVMSGFGKSNAIAAADRQLLDDLSLARARAIAEHTTVYVVFVPTNMNNSTFTMPTDPFQLAMISNVYGGQYTTYALLSLRTVGDQPGRPTARYLTAWRTLPSGVFIATNKFNPTLTLPPPPLPQIPPFHHDILFPFPIISTNNPPNNTNLLPYVAFDYLGRLALGNPAVAATSDEYIPLSRGAVFTVRDASGRFDITKTPEAKETPIGNSINISNVVHIDALTGRARIEKQELQ